MLLFAPETRALWDLVAGLRFLVGVLLSGVPLPLSRSPRSLSRAAPEGGIASNICSMLENPGAQIDADLVFRRGESSAIPSNYRGATAVSPRQMRPLRRLVVVLSRRLSSSGLSIPEETIQPTERLPPPLRLTP